MATKAYILIETAVGKSREVIVSLEKLSGVKAVDAVTGPYDIIVLAECTDLNAIGDLVSRGIHPLEGITRTVTCLSVKLK